MQRATRRARADVREGDEPEVSILQHVPNGVRQHEKHGGGDKECGAPFVPVHKCTNPQIQTA